MTEERGISQDAIESTIRAAVEGNVAVFYPCECLEHSSGYEHFVAQLSAALTGAAAVVRVGEGEA